MKNRTLSKIFGVLSNPTRLKIYTLILKGACESDPNCATSIAEKLKLHQPTVSNHIKELINANLIIIKKSGRHSYLYGIKKSTTLLFGFSSEIKNQVTKSA